jgi:hypothetical protein
MVRLARADGNSSGTELLVLRLRDRVRILDPNRACSRDAMEEILGEAKSIRPRRISATTASGANVSRSASMDGDRLRTLEVDLRDKLRRESVADTSDGLR